MAYGSLKVDSLQTSTKTVTIDTLLGSVDLSSAIDSTSTTTAANSAAVKVAYDLAAAALSKGGGTMTGTIAFADGQTISGYATLGTAQTFTAAQRGTISALGAVSAGTTTLDFATANHYSLSLPAGGTVTLANPSNLTAGQSGCVVVTQNGTTAALVAYGTAWKFQGGVPTMSTELSSVNVIVYFVESGSRVTAQLLANTIS